MPGKATKTIANTQQTGGSRSLPGAVRLSLMRGSGRDAQGTDALYSARRWPRT